MNESGFPSASPPSATLPSGTVTFLFSDIEGSTRRWESHREAMQEALPRHDNLIHSAVKRHNGYLFKTIGDACCVAFSTAPQALAAAIDVQRALAMEDFSAVDGLRVRIAVHAGHADERDGDYFGPAVNRIARLLSIGHGGQILISRAVKELSEGSLSPETSLRDLGTHLLKDLTAPEHVYQMVAPQLQANFPALRSLDELPNNLPRRVTRFIGREQEFEAVKELISSAPLVTLVGAGGVGKSRLALHVGADLLDGSGDGVWFVDLAPLRDPQLVASAVAEIFGVRESADRPLTESLVFALRTKKALLIFDNCEHLVKAVSYLVATLIHECPQIRVLATSRQPLEVPGEQTYRVGSLAIPQDDAIAANLALNYAAIALFTDRAKLANESFALTNENAPIIARICRRLDGIALAIELAAPRLKILSPQQLEERLSERFRVLTGGSRMALPRQQTMRALIDWSYDLLEDEEKALFARLAVFVGDFSFEAATGVCADNVIDEWRIFELMASLVDKSLVTSELHDAAQRYRLLESMRAYAFEKAAPEMALLNRRHAEYYATVAERAQAAFVSAHSATKWINDLEPDFKNIRAALDWTLANRGDVALGVRLLTSVHELWARSGLAAEAARRAEGALAIAADLPQPLRAALWLTLARIRNILFLPKQASDAAIQARILCEATGDRAGLAQALRSYGNAQTLLGAFAEGELALQQALALQRTLDDPRGTTLTLNNLATNLHISGRSEKARTAILEVLEMVRDLGDEHGVGMTLLNLAEMEFALGEVQRAIGYAKENLANDLSRRDPALRLNQKCNLASYLCAIEAEKEAAEIALEALKDAENIQDRSKTAIALQHLAAILARRDAKHAAQLLRFVDRAFTITGIAREFTERYTYEQLLKVLHETLSDNEIAEFGREGAEMTQEQAAKIAQRSYP